MRFLIKVASSLRYLSEKKYPAVMKKSGMWNSKMNLHSHPGASACAMTIRMIAMPLAMDMVVSLFTLFTS